MLIALAVFCCAGCGESSDPDAAGVVLYSSADSVYVRPIIRAFEEETGIRVRYAGDTEATKTTGLAARLLEEHRGNATRADVWWSSEPFWTIRMAEEGVFEPYTSESAEASIDGGWPGSLRADDETWYGFALRSRVFVYNTNYVHGDEVPGSLADLTDERFRGRIGLARPEFGTTRGHMGAIMAAVGDEAFVEWLHALDANGVRLYDGNMSVVRAVSSGEIYIGVTDTDDVWAGKRNGWPVEMAFERLGRPNDTDDTGDRMIKDGMGALVMPNTVALVAGGPNPEAGRRLIDFLLSDRVARMLAESDSRNMPVDPALAAEYDAYAFGTPAAIDLEEAAAMMDEAVARCAEALGGR